MECLGTHIQRHFLQLSFSPSCAAIWPLNKCRFSPPPWLFCSYCGVLDCLWTFITGPSVVSSGHWPSLKPPSFSTSGALIKQTTQRRCRHTDPPRPIKRDSDTCARRLHRSPKCTIVLICSPTSAATASVECDHIPEPLTLQPRQRVVAGLHPHR